MFPLSQVTHFVTDVWFPQRHHARVIDLSCQLVWALAAVGFFG